MKTTVRDIGQFLEQQAKRGRPITYQEVINQFPDLPPLTEYWKSHPLCDIFGELDGRITGTSAHSELHWSTPRQATVLGMVFLRPSKGYEDKPYSNSNRTRSGPRSFQH
jgi:hypothetical protein